jgi:transcriptional regulator with XRE-family HTH domain
MDIQPSPAQLRAGRALLGLDQEPVARDAGISIATLRRVEAGTAPTDTARRVAETLGRAGIRFIENGVQRNATHSAVTSRSRRIDEILARADAVPVIDPNITEDSLYGNDGLPH